MKVKVISESDEDKFEKEIKDFINNTSLWGDRVNKVHNISYSYNRNNNFVEPTIHSALILYE